MIIDNLSDEAFLQFQIDYSEYPKILEAYLSVDDVKSTLLCYVSVKGDPEKLPVITIRNETTGEHFLPIRESYDIELVYAYKATKAISGHYITRKAKDKLNSKLTTVVESSNGTLRFKSK